MSSQAVPAGRGSAWSDPRQYYEQHRFAVPRSLFLDQRDAPAEQPVLQVTNPRISV